MLSACRNALILLGNRQFTLMVDVDNQRQSLKDLAEKYTSIRRKDYLEWRIRLEHEMTKAGEK